MLFREEDGEGEEQRGKEKGTPGGKDPRRTGDEGIECRQQGPNPEDSLNVPEEVQRQQVSS